MKRILVIASAAAAWLVAAAPASPQEQLSFKLLGGLARVQGDDYNAGVRGALQFARDTSAALSGSYKTLGGSQDFQGEIINFWGPHFGVGIGAGYYRVTNSTGISGTALGSDPAAEFTSLYTPKVTVIPLFLNFHWKTRLTPRAGLDLFGGPVFQIVQFGFGRDETSTTDPTAVTETFNASGTALGLQGGLSLSYQVVRGVAIVVDGFYRASKITDVKGNWFLNTTTAASGTVTQSSSSYYFWFFNDTQGAVYQRFGFFDASGPSGPNVSGARHADINVSGLVALVGVKFSL